MSKPIWGIWCWFFQRLFTPCSCPDVMFGHYPDLSVIMEKRDLVPATPTAVATILPVLDFLLVAFQPKDLQRRTCLGDCFGTVSVSTLRRGRDKGVTRLVLSLTISQDETETRQTNLVSDWIPGTNPSQAPRVEREETKDVEIVAKACHMTTRVGQ
ncbi:hypothetical protein PROFUN_16677 [Planoprotostelium fungivorum]|uniref:Uncharacterized protein n=1 Tax=Planoprotostelium fungivorum TaxID=1890364 RepID=A0A2P6MPQ0_9EUKA|nr:hypothetical protein PROFUN_16677 [Planoprotostelium fungivorum]